MLFRPADVGGRLGVEGEGEVNGVDTAGRCGGSVSVQTVAVQTVAVQTVAGE